MMSSLAWNAYQSFLKQQEGRQANVPSTLLHLAFMDDLCGIVALTDDIGLIGQYSDWKQIIHYYGGSVNH